MQIAIGAAVPVVNLQSPISAIPLKNNSKAD